MGNNELPASPTGDTTQHKVRLARVLDKRHSRTSKHIHQFFRLTVVVNNEESFELTVDRTQTVEYLAKQIEAEYAYRSALSPGSTSSDQSGQPTRLEIGMLHDAGMLGLRFTDEIGAVLGGNDTVYAINTYEESTRRADVQYMLKGEELDVVIEGNASASGNDQESDRTRASTTINNSGVSVSVQPASNISKTQTVTSLHSMLTNDSNVGSAYPPNAFGSLSSVNSAISRTRPLSLLTNPTMDDRLQAVLHNRLALRFFTEFCIEEYTIENLLFWIDVETFQTYDQEFRSLYAKYIYLTYIHPEWAPLQVNISAEVRRDIHWPLQGNGFVPDVSVFDEAQEQVYGMLKGHSYARFERSAKFAQFLELKRADRAAYNEAKLRGPFSQHFSQNVAVMRSIVRFFEEPNNTLSAAHSNPAFAADNALGAAYGSSAALNATFKEAILSKTMTEYFPLASRIIDGYFSDNQRTSWSAKQRKMAKEKKLAKFFGERPTREQIVRQTEHLSSGTKAVALGDTGGLAPLGKSLNALHLESSYASLMSTQEERLLYEEDDEGRLSGSSGSQAISGGGSTDVHESAHRRRKVEKLEGFFGDRLPNKQLRVQNLVTGQPTSATNESGELIAEGVVVEEEGLSLTDSNSSSSEEVSMVPGATTNELDSAQRRILTKRTRKIQNVLGHRLDENTVQRTLTEPVVNAAQVQVQLNGGDIATPKSGAGGGADASAVAGQGSTIALDDSQSLFDGEDLLDDMNLDASVIISRKKKMDKISQFLGERISVDKLQEISAPATNLAKLAPRPLTADEKLQAKKRLNKLERVLGHVPPPESLAQSFASPVSASPARGPKDSVAGAPPGPRPNTVSRVSRAIRTLSEMLQRGDVVDLLEKLTFEEEGPKSPAVDGSFSLGGAPPATAAPTSPSSANANSPDSQSLLVPEPAPTKESRQRRLNKLRKFFGDMIDFEVLIEQQILHDLERSIIDEAGIGPGVDQDEQLRQMHVDISILRDIVRRQSDQLKQEMQGGQPGEYHVITGADGLLRPMTPRAVLSRSNSTSKVAESGHVGNGAPVNSGRAY